MAMDQINGKVCVTGASGYLASWLVKRLLLAGYHVTGTVRDPGNERKLAHLWRLEGAKERLQIVRANLMDEGSFDDAINGCQGAEIIEPAVNGTLNVLRSCQKNPSLRRVVLTSSSSTVRIRYDFDSKIPLDESSWSSVDLCESLQLMIFALIYLFLRNYVLRKKIWYALSKILAEKAAWEFCGHNGIDLVTILPSFVIGPSLPPDLCSTASDVLGLLKGEKEKFQWHGRMGYVHIDDVALCHILVYEHQNSHGRYLCSSTVVDNNELVSLLSTRYPLLPIPERFELLDRPYYEFNTSKLTSLLGFKFKSIEEMFDDCIAWFDEQGYLC
ncbi:tetraketide alpha-pyrone reductase 1 [Citrus sinensis]|uniref:Tetraketide alpha-pyrone reductase 1 n=1 Tax=Citrus sinensis TaxID=2711 RepID=A0ACB8IB46_CITSI|nr:tetraketide alpha-pyrone reductase 1 [Citrus sinensis]